MAWFKNIHMAPKLVSSFILVALLAGIVGVAGIMGLNATQAKMDTITGSAVPSVIA